jgi:hypothetical protein
MVREEALRESHEATPEDEEEDAAGDVDVDEGGCDEDVSVDGDLLPPRSAAKRLRNFWISGSTASLEFEAAGGVVLAGERLSCTGVDGFGGEGEAQSQPMVDRQYCAMIMSGLDGWMDEEMDDCAVSGELAGCAPTLVTGGEIATMRGAEQVS